MAPFMTYQIRLVGGVGLGVEQLAQLGSQRPRAQHDLCRPSAKIRSAMVEAYDESLCLLAGMRCDSRCCCSAF